MGRQTNRLKESEVNVVRPRVTCLKPSVALNWSFSVFEKAPGVKEFSWQELSPVCRAIRGCCRESTRYPKKWAARPHIRNVLYKESLHIRNADPLAVKFEITFAWHYKRELEIVKRLLSRATCSIDCNHFTIVNGLIEHSSGMWELPRSRLDTFRTFHRTKSQTRHLNIIILSQNLGEGNLFILTSKIFGRGKQLANFSMNLVPGELFHPHYY